MSPRKDFERDGVIIVRGLVGEPHITRCLAEYRSDRCAKDIRWNPVEIPVPPDGEVADLATHSGIGQFVSSLIGEHDIYNVRLTVKNANRAGAVFLHQDCAYHLGGMNKLSAFVALTEVTRDNGALRFYLGTHRFGYLGDAGELDPGILGNGESWIEAHLSPGDVVFMHSALWHRSTPWKDGAPERVIADIIYMPMDDPARLMSWEMREGKMFLRSRSSRLRELQAQVDGLSDDLKDAT